MFFSSSLGSGFTRLLHKALIVASIILLVTLTVINSSQTATAAGFVTRSGSQFSYNGSPFYFGGTNNYYLIYKSNKMVDNVLQNASAMGLKVVRHWAMLDMGSLDGSVPSIDGGPKDNVYFQYWDKTAGKPAYNDSATGLQKLDYVIKKAGDLGIKVIPVLVNNWSAFGGMDQYVQWYGLTYHDQFYTDSRARQAYKDWVSHVINRVNSITGVAYKNDPAIFAWELANEPRCKGSGNKPTSSTCTTSTLTTWANEMSTYIKSIDTNHMVAMGDEGFFNRTGSSDWTYAGGEGVDNEALMRLANIDFGTFHIYPQDWGNKSDAWSTQWVTDHVQAAQTIGKPILFEEFGYKDQTVRDNYYTSWTNTFCKGGGNGWTFWILTGIQDDGSLYPDYDGYRVTYPSTSASVLSSQAAKITQRQCNSTPLPTNTPKPATATPKPATATFAPPTNTPNGPTATPRPTNTPIPSTGGLKVQVQLNGNDNAQETGFKLNVVNTGTTAKSNITVRIYFTLDGSQPASKYVLERYWSTVADTVSGPTAYSGSIYYYTINFGTATLNPGANWESHHDLHLSDWSTNYSSANDWWHTGGLTTSWVDTPYVPAYVSGSLAWGKQP